MALLSHITIHVYHTYNTADSERTLSKPAQKDACVQPTSVKILHLGGLAIRRGANSEVLNKLTF